MIEREVENRLAAMVAMTGGEIRKVQWVGRRGAPDRLCFWPGGPRFFAELKRPGAKPDPHQEREIARLREAGFEVYTIDTTEQVDQIVTELLA